MLIYIFYHLTTYLNTDETWDLICTKKLEQNNYFNFFFFCLTEWPTIKRDGAMKKETFYQDGLIKRKKRIIFLLYLNISHSSSIPSQAGDRCSENYDQLVLIEARKVLSPSTNLHQDLEVLHQHDSNLARKHCLVLVSPVYLL